VTATAPVPISGTGAAALMVRSPPAGHAFQYRSQYIQSTGSQTKFFNVLLV
jgi:hypothetical protein